MRDATLALPSSCHAGGAEPVAGYRCCAAPAELVAALGPAFGEEQAHSSGRASPVARSSRDKAGHQRGFTLIEVLVAVAVMALLALMSWRGLDGISRVTTLNQQRGDALLTLQTGLSQWTADLDALATLAQTQPIDWDGRVLRLTRRSTDPLAPAMLVVAWTLHPDTSGMALEGSAASVGNIGNARTPALTGSAGTRWYRWQSPALVTRAEWQQAWAQAAAWGANDMPTPGDAAVALMPVDSWQLYYFHDASWNVARNTPASAAPGTAAAGTTGASSAAGAALTAVPDGVRLELSLSPGAGLTGVLTRDWVRPTIGAPRS